MMDDSWSGLPSEVLSFIFSHLFLERDHVIFRAVCKSWKSVTALRRPIPFDFSFSARRRMSTFLMSHKGDERYDFLHPTQTSYYLHIPELSDKKILYSKYGWLLVAGTGDEILSIFLFHPLTKEKIVLPNLPSYNFVSEFGFYSLPTSPECVVVAQEVGGCIFKNIVTVKPGEEDWSEERLYLDHERFHYGGSRFFISCSPAFDSEGKCYCLDKEGKVCVFDPMDVEGSWKFCAQPYSKVPRISSVVQNFIVESDGELLTVFLGYQGKVWICKLNPDTEEWTEVRDLGNKVLYLSNGASWAERAVFEELGNRIYFPMLCGNSNTIAFYSLATRRFHSYGCDFSQENFYNMKQLYHSTWIELNHGIQNHHSL